MKENLKILLLEDWQGHINNLQEMFRQRGHFIFARRSAKKLCTEILEEGLDYDLAIIDRETGENDYSGDNVIQQLRDKYPKKPIIGYTGYDVNDVSGADVVLRKMKDFIFEDDVWVVWQRAIEQAFNKAAERQS